MFCPKCGETLVDVAGELTCPRGNMGLSQKMASDLYECFVTETRLPKEREYNFQWGETWFCPGCGIQMIEGDKGAVRCPQCHKNLSEFIYNLIERHPHEN